ncbi:MAG: YciI family protein [Chloroflexota bacterium]|nr:YciI family protein [Chloroflexota bacterium]
MPQYMLMFVTDESQRTARDGDDAKNIYAAIGTWWDEHLAKGVIKGGQELKDTKDATTVRRVNGHMTVSEGPFIESKEHVGGFALIQVDDLDAAIAVAKTWPGRSTTVEVRPIVER